MRITHLIESIDIATGGPPAVVFNLAAHQAALGAHVRVVTAATDSVPASLAQWQRQCQLPESVELQTLPSGWRRLDTLAAALRGIAQGSDVLHVHGLWGPLAWSALAAPVVAAGPVLLAPHGMLSGWSLAQKRLKKQLALRLGWRRAIQRCAAVHCLNEAEQRELNARFPGVATLVLPNGVSAAAAATSGAAPQVPSVLFLARLHRMKGPARLLDAFAYALSQEPSLASCRLIMAGPDAGEGEALRLQAQRLGIAAQVEFPGAVFGAAKQRLLESATLLCQPSLYEGFSVTLLEALAVGLPVVTTPEANFPQIQAAGAGIVCEGAAVPLGSALLAMLKDAALRTRMGCAGRQLVADHYTWDRIAQASLALYAGLSRGREPQRRAG